MTEQQRYCMRCGSPAVRGDSETEEIWRCPNQHGVIYKAALPEAPPAAQTETLPDEPGEEEDTEQHEDDAEDKEDARPEARARAPAAHRRPPAAKKKPVKAAKRK